MNLLKRFGGLLTLVLLATLINSGTGCSSSNQAVTTVPPAHVNDTYAKSQFTKSQLEVIIRSFFRDIDSKEYAAAYNSVSDEFKREHPFKPWSAGYQDTLNHSISSIECRNDQCEVVAVATEVGSTRARRQRYTFEYSFVSDDNSNPLIDSASLESSELIEDLGEAYASHNLYVDYSSQTKTLSAEVITPTNQSSCIWEYSSGNGNIPNSQITTESSHHSIDVFLDGLASNVDVVCADAFHNKYTGVYSLDRAQRELQIGAAATQPLSSEAPRGTYVNAYNNEVPRPFYAPSRPAGASAQCSDGTYSFSQSRRGTCSHHGGVASWF